MNEKVHIDIRTLHIEKDGENEEFVDYFYLLDVFSNDPRDSDKKLCLGQMKGLIRINKADLNPELLLPHPHDGKLGGYLKASMQVIKHYEVNNEFPS